MREVLVAAAVVCLLGCGGSGGGQEADVPTLQAGNACFLVEGGEQCGLAGGAVSRLVCKAGVF